MCAKTPPAPKQSGPPAPAAPPPQDPAEAPEPKKGVSFGDINKAGYTQLLNKRNFTPTPNIGAGVGTALAIPS